MLPLFEFTSQPVMQIEAYLRNFPEVNSSNKISFHLRYQNHQSRVRNGQIVTRSPTQTVLNSPPLQRFLVACSLVLNKTRNHIMHAKSKLLQGISIRDYLLVGLPQLNELQ